jgi:hypothetical protein
MVNDLSINFTLNREFQRFLASDPTTAINVNCTTVAITWAFTRSRKHRDLSGRAAGMIVVAPGALYFFAVSISRLLS